MSHTITINGTIYDAHTGLPITPTSSDNQTNSSQVHARVQRSETLVRRTVADHSAPKVVHHHVRHVDGITKTHPAISKYADHPATVARSTPDIPAMSHPLVSRAQPRPVAERITKPSDIIKREAIDKALADAPAHGNRKQVKLARSAMSRRLSVVSASLAFVMLGAYFTYLNMPNLSVRIAAAQAGFNASYPSYHPDGYSLSGPVAYNDGKVSMNFKANGSSNTFALAESKTDWDSAAALENYVAPASNGNYATTEDSGLTIYTYDQNAAWVNGGILYTIQGDSPLSPAQISRIATSL